MARQLAFHFDSNLCTGCKACQVACKDRADLPVGVTWRRVAEYSAGNWIAAADGSFFQDVRAYYVSVSCNHCKEAPCVQICPTTAMHRRPDGIVLVDEGKCVGCRYCEWACPYHAPQYSAERGVMTKCNFCVDALDAGGVPTCVAACPSRALAFGDRAELEARHGALNEIAPLPAARFTDPSLILTPHRHAAPAGAGPVANPEEV